jgi:hypothetical protein
MSQAIIPSSRTFAWKVIRGVDGFPYIGDDDGALASLQAADARKRAERIAWPAEMLEILNG